MKKAANVIKRCLEAKGFSQRHIARCMGEDVRHLNQQLNRHEDMKVERFIEVLEHIGYRVEIVENDGIRKVSPDYAKEVIENGVEAGKNMKFWHGWGGKYTGISAVGKIAVVKEFGSKEDCFQWLKEM